MRVRGGAKVMCHLMFGLIALTASALFARIALTDRSRRPRWALRLRAPSSGAPRYGVAGPRENRRAARAKTVFSSFTSVTPAFSSRAPKIHGGFERASINK